jgi:hypothetical protein
MRVMKLLKIPVIFLMFPPPKVIETIRRDSRGIPTLTMKRAIPPRANPTAISRKAIRTIGIEITP